MIFPLQNVFTLNAFIWVEFPNLPSMPLYDLNFQAYQWIYKVFRIPIPNCLSRSVNRPTKRSFVQVKPWQWLEDETESQVRESLKTKNNLSQHLYTCIRHQDTKHEIINLLFNAKTWGLWFRYQVIEHKIRKILFNAKTWEDTQL
jgi:hypothetical protein